MGKLTTKTVESLAKAGTPGMTRDGLYFQISRTGGISWINRYKISGKTRDMGSGQYPLVSLAAARDTSVDLRKLVRAARHEIRVDDVLPPLPAQSQRYRDLRARLEEQQSADLPAHRRIDPTQITLAVRNSGGQIRLSLSSRDETLPALAKRAVQLVHAVYLNFLKGPGRLEWVTEAFGLAADNPRFP